MMCVVTILWLSGLTLTIGVHLHRMNKFMNLMRAKFEKLYEQESKKAKGKESSAEEDSDAGSASR